METTGAGVLSRLRSRITSEIGEPTRNKITRWAVAAVAVAFAIACIVFGCVYSWSPNMVLAMRESFAFFWIALGVGVFVSTFGIAKWLGEREG